MMISRSTKPSRSSNKGETDKKDILERFIYDFGIEPGKIDMNEFVWIKKFLCKIPEGIDANSLGEAFFAGESYAILDKKLVPTLKFLELIKKYGAECMRLNDKASWLFICGRDILSQGIVGELENTKKTKKILVSNLRGEILGVAQRSGKELDNYWHIGDYLKRENHREN